MKRHLIVGLALTVVACQPDQRGPTAPPLRHSDLAAAAAPEGKPDSYPFGADSYRIGVFTGGGPKLRCSPSPSGGRICDGYLRSFDRTALDVRLEIPATPGPYPLIALIHGYAGSKTSSGDIASQLLAEGYAVLRYSTRGFGDSWGQVNLADLNAEIGDLRSMIGNVVDDDDYELDPAKVAVTGASYGGGHSWLALVTPTFESPEGRTVNIAAVVPIAPWTDLLYSLVPNGRPRESVSGLGGLKMSFANGLYASGIRRNPARPYPNYPDYFIGWHAWLNTTEPNSFDPIWMQIVDGLAGYRSIWWQQQFWQRIAATHVPIFQVQGFTDDLFPLPEAKRMLLALKTIDADYPITSYFGDLGHPRASNKPAEVQYVLDLIKPWLAYYLKGIGAEPPIPQIYAARTHPRDEPFDTDVLQVKNWSDLWRGTACKVWTGDPLTPLVNPFTYAQSGATWDPFVMEGAEQLKPYLETPPAPVIVSGSFASFSVDATALSGGGDLTISGQPSVTLNATVVGHRVQLDVRLIDVGGATENLITRGTYTIDAGAGVNIGAQSIVIPTYGNYWRVGGTHTIRLEISNVDAPYITPSREPSSTIISTVRLEIPTREPLSCG
jgi:pimeloyl-ACP methyl ester carboxylesterase